MNLQVSQKTNHDIYNLSEHLNLFIVLARKRKKITH